MEISEKQIKVLKDWVNRIESPERTKIVLDMYINDILKQNKKNHHAKTLAVATFIFCLITAWVFGFADGKRISENKISKRYEWINEELRTDIQNCRDTLNQCKRDLDNPHHCVSTCVEQFEKFGC